MTAPSIRIELPLEDNPHITLDVLNQIEEQRLNDWIDSHHELRDLVDTATNLSHLPDDR